MNSIHSFRHIIIHKKYIVIIECGMIVIYLINQNKYLFEIWVKLIKIIFNINKYYEYYILY
jgi:hypothetical protein